MNVFMAIMTVVFAIAALIFAVGVLCLGLGVIWGVYGALGYEEDPAHSFAVGIDYGKRFNDNFDRIVEGYDRMIRMTETQLNDIYGQDEDSEVIQF